MQCHWAESRALLVLSLWRMREVVIFNVQKIYLNYIFTVPVECFTAVCVSRCPSSGLYGVHCLHLPYNLVTQNMAIGPQLQLWFLAHGQYFTSSRVFFCFIFVLFLITIAKQRLHGYKNEEVLWDGKTRKCYHRCAVDLVCSSPHPVPRYMPCKVSSAQAGIKSRQTKKARDARNTEKNALQGGYQLPKTGS